MRHQLGVTLIELVVVLFIIVLGFAAIGININSGNRTAQMKATVRDLTSALRYARGQALITHQDSFIAIDLGENTYVVSNRSKTYHFTDDMEVTMVIAQDELEQDEIGKIRFFPDGSSSGGRITLEWGGVSDKIDINWLSGKINVINEEQ